MSWLERVVLSTPMLAEILRGIGKCSKEALWIILVGGFCLRSSEEVDLQQLLESLGEL